MSLHWAGPRDVLSLGHLLTEAFGPPGLLTRCRFSMKVLTTPHLTTAGRDVVVGFKPLAPDKTGLKSMKATALWFALGSGRTFHNDRLPIGLQAGTPCTWRMMNFVSARGAPAMQAVYLGRTIVALADRYGVQLEMEPTVSARLLGIYRRHGFVPAIASDPTSKTYTRKRVEGQRASVRSGSTASWRSVLRTGRMTIAKHEQLFDRAFLDGPVLDLGSGDSPLPAELADRGVLAVPCDPQYHLQPATSPVAVAAAGEALPFCESSFSEVYASFVLMHIPDAHAAIQEMVRVARPGGRLYIAPIWTMRRQVRYLESLPSVQLTHGRIWPRLRGSISVQVSAGLPDPTLTRAVANISGPLLPVRLASRVIMSALARVRGTTSLDTGRLTLHRQRPESLCT